MCAAAVLCCAQVVPDNYLYARVALIVKDKSTLSEEKLPELVEVLVEESKAQEVSMRGGGRDTCAGGGLRTLDLVVLVGGLLVVGGGGVYESLWCV